jgi:CheY-like chemotaxis protein
MALPTRPVNDAGGRILVVDDSAKLRTALIALLASLGFSCTEAADGAEAFDLFLQHAFDLVITDLEMPRVDGFQLLAAVGLMPAWRRPPVIVLSDAPDDPRVKGRPELKTARAVLAKPVDTKALLRAVADILDGPGPRG